MLRFLTILIFNYLAIFLILDLPDYFIKIENHTFVEYKVKSYLFSFYISIIVFIINIFFLIYLLKYTKKTNKQMINIFIILFFFTNSILKYLIIGSYVTLNYYILIKLDLPSYTEKIQVLNSYYLYYIVFTGFIILFYFFRKNFKSFKS